MDLKKYIRSIQDYPKKGILFRDITTLIKNKDAFRDCIDQMSKILSKVNYDKIAAIESRGFIFASILAQIYSKGMVMLRKEGKLPGKTVKTSYTIEYGKAVLEIQKNALNGGERVIICDDLLATGGTAKAAAKLVERIGAKVAGFAFIIELTELNGIKEINNYKTVSLVQY